MSVEKILEINKMTAFDDVEKAKMIHALFFKNESNVPANVPTQIIQTPAPIIPKIVIEIRHAKKETLFHKFEIDVVNCSFVDMYGFNHIGTIRENCTKNEKNSKNIHSFIKNVKFFKELFEYKERNISKEYIQSLFFPNLNTTSMNIRGLWWVLENGDINVAKKNALGGKYQQFISNVVSKY